MRGGGRGEEGSAADPRIPTAHLRLSETGMGRTSSSLESTTLHEPTAPATAPSEPASLEATAAKGVGRSCAR